MSLRLRAAEILLRFDRSCAYAGWSDAGALIERKSGRYRSSTAASLLALPSAELAATLALRQTTLTWATKPVPDGPAVVVVLGLNPDAALAGVLWLLFEPPQPVAPMASSASTTA